MGLLSVGLIFLTVISAAFIDTSNDFDRRSYENYKVYQIQPRTQNEVNFLAELEQIPEFYGLDFWMHDKNVGNMVEVMVEPETQQNFEELLTKNTIPFNIFIHDVQQQIDEEYLENNAFRFTRSGGQTSSSSLDFSRYYTYDEIMEYIRSLAEQYPTIIKVLSAGKSHEDRDIPLVLISNGDNNEMKDTIVLDAGIHAREWIAPAEAMYVINQLVENNTAYSDILNGLNWVIIPIINVDGYVFTHTKDRLWRKSRKPSDNNCFGTDLNRNFDYKWGIARASANPCSNTYRGPHAFSEPEAKAVRDVLKRYQNQAKFYLTLHAYGNYLLYPWGYTSELPHNWEAMDTLAKVGGEAIKEASGENYTIGSSTNTLYSAAGGSDDYALGALNIPYSMTMELPKGGKTGFEPSPSEIERIVRQTWIGIHAMANYLTENNK